MPYQSDAHVASAIATGILNVFSAQSSSPTLRFMPTNSADLATLLAIEPGSAVTVVETVTGINSFYWVNHVSLVWQTSTIVVAELVLCRSTAS
jgi:hypothetical protein